MWAFLDHFGPQVLHPWPSAFSSPRTWFLASGLQSFGQGLLLSDFAGIRQKAVEHGEGTSRCWGGSHPYVMDSEYFMTSML